MSDAAETQTNVTRINKMVMKGFKSFANKTEIPFQTSFNCILGPNGSGKSNVLDSLCFVLGKSGAKSMRAEKSANLIYNGGKSKKAAKQGEVHIYFDNSSGVFPVDGDEVKISRVVKQNGSSDYKIDGETVTRTQIVDLLSHAKINPDGYNIILQGDITRLVEMSPLERRGIIEEISGISIYEDKKNKAQRELDRVEEQLKDADIVLAERKTYLTELKKERDQAMKFKELDEKIKRNKATVLHRKITDREKKIEELDKKIIEEQEKVADIQSDIDEKKKEVLERKKEIDEISREIEDKGEKEQVALMREVETIKVDLAVKEQRQEQLKQELERISTRRKDLQSSHVDAEKKIKQLEKDIKTAEKRIKSREEDRKKIEKKVESFRKKNDLASAADLDEQVVALDKQAEQVQEEIGKLRGEQQELFRKRDQVEYRIQTIDEKVEKVMEAQKENKQQLDVLKTKRKELKGVESELKQSLDRSSELVPEIQTAKGKLETRQEQLAKLRSRQASIEERTAGSRAVAAILKLKAKDKKIYGTVAELGDVSSKFSLALEIAAGSRLRSIVVEDDSTAQKCIRYLKDNRLGVATFLPLNKLKHRPIPAELRSLKQSGVHGLALDLVSFEKRFEKAFLHTLGSTLVVDNITAARKVGVGRTRMVTLEGDLVEASGAMTGGHRARKKTSGMGFQEKELTRDLQRIEKEAADLEAVLSELTGEQRKLSERIEELRKSRHELENDVLELERELHIDSDDVEASKEDKKRLREEHKELDGKVDELAAEISGRNKRLAKIKTDRMKLREKLTSLRSPQALAELNTFQEQREKISSEIATIKAEKEGLSNQINNIHRPELENIESILSQQEKEEKSFTKEQENLVSELKDMKSSLKEKQGKEEAFRKQFKELFEKRSSLESAKDKLENGIINQEEKSRGIEHKLNASKIQLASQRAELSGFKEEFKDFEHVEPYKTKSDDDIAAEIKQFEKMVEGLGAVNMKALEVYERVESEYDSLVEKKEVLAKERQDVLVMINEIDAKKREMFMQTFEVIEKHFKRIFLQLSRKGEAFLELEEPKDPFAGGMSIRVRLSGNKFMDIRSLSGGEKTMTALAFLFAIQEYQPASFYVLDEVDAALDKKNSERLAQLIREYCDDAQYVIISHNDTVISEADTLFGVSMNEHGISQVTSLQI